MSGPGPSRRARITVALALLAIPIALTYAWNVWRNLDSLARVESACGRIRSARASAWGSLEQPAIGLFESDLPVVRALFAELGNEPCREVPRAIGMPLGWRWGAAWAGAPYPADRLDELAAASARARERCPRLFASFLASVSDPARAEDAARDACEQMMQGFDAYASAPREAGEPLALWEWPAQLEHLAGALESIPAP